MHWSANMVCSKIPAFSIDSVEIHSSDLLTAYLKFASLFSLPLLEKSSYDCTFKSCKKLECCILFSGERISYSGFRLECLCTCNLWDKGVATGIAGIFAIFAIPHKNNQVSFFIHGFGTCEFDSLRSLNSQWRSHLSSQIWQKCASSHIQRSGKPQPMDSLIHEFLYP